MKKMLLMGLLLFIFFPRIASAQNAKVIVFITEEDTWGKWIQDEFIQYLLPQSGIGYMNIRTNHKNQISEYYAIISKGERINYFDIHPSGAIENGLGDILSQQGFSIAFLGHNTHIANMVKNDHLALLSIEENTLGDRATVKATLDQAQLILIEKEYLTAQGQVYEWVKEYALRHASYIYIVCPYSKQRNITPILLYDSNISQEGLLTSPTTKRLGLTVNLDIAPSIIHHVGASNLSYMRGKMINDYTKDAFTLLQHEFRKARYTSLYRGRVIKYYILFLIAVLLLFLGTLILPIRTLLKATNYGIWIGLWIPSVFLLTPMSGIYQLFLVPLLLLLLLFLKSYSTSKSIEFQLISITGVFLIMIDLLYTSVLQRFSFFGYDSFIGARFYGIGNEYAGVLIGSFFLWLYTQKNTKYHPYFGTLASGILVLFMGLPFLGANVGGTIAATSGILVYWLSYYKRKIPKRVYTYTVLLILILVGVWIWIDLFVSFSPSHLGQTLLQFSQEGSSVFITILKRKFFMNLTLIYHSLWTKFIFFSTLVLFVLKKDNSILHSIGIPMLVSVTTALLCNDSGIIMASISMIYLVFPACYLYNQKR